MVLAQCRWALFLFSTDKDGVVRHPVCISVNCWSTPPPYPTISHQLTTLGYCASWEVAYHILFIFLGWRCWEVDILLLLLLLLLEIWVEDSVSVRSSAENDEYFFPWRRRWRHFWRWWRCVLPTGSAFAFNYGF